MKTTVARIAAAAAALLAATPAAAQQGGHAGHGAPAPAARAQAPQPVLSPRDTAEARVPGGRVLVDYGRPFMRGRRIMGELVPFGQVWRTGANAATTFVTDVDLVIGGTRVPRGTYTLYTLPTASAWTLIVNRQTGQWGTQYTPSRDLARIPMTVTRVAQPVEQFTIEVQAPASGRDGALVLSWENTRATVPFRVAPAAGTR